MMVTKVTRWFRNLSLARKLMSLTVLTSSIALMLAGLIIVSADFWSMRDRLRREVGMLAQITGENSTAAMAFADLNGATEVLRAVSADDQVISATLILRDGSAFANYSRTSRSIAPAAPFDELVERGHRQCQPRFGVDDPRFRTGVFENRAVIAQSDDAAVFDRDRLGHARAATRSHGPARARHCRSRYTFQRCRR